MSDDFPGGNTLQGIEIRTRKRTDDIERRLMELEQWRAMFDAVNQERRQQTADAFDRVNARLDKIDAAVAKIFWVVVVAILSAVINFIVQGGLNIAP